LRGPFRIERDLRHQRDVMRHVAATTGAAIMSSIIETICLKEDHAISRSEFWPLAGQGDTLGVLHLGFARASETGHGAQGHSPWSLRQALATTAAGQIAFSMKNLQSREHLREQPIRDPLTGLYNRRFMLESLGRELERARRKEQSLSVLFVDRSLQKIQRYFWT